MPSAGEPLTKVLAQIAKGRIPPILVLRFDPDDGEDLLGRDQLVGELERAMLGDSPDIFGRTVLDSATVTLVEVLDAAREVSLLSPRRLVLVRGGRVAAGSQSDSEDPSSPGGGETEGDRGGEGAQLAVLKRYLAGASRSACIVFIGCSWDARRRIHKALLEGSTVVDVSRPDPREIPAWIENRVRAAGGTIEPDAIVALAELAGNDTLRLRSEIEKLVLHAGSGSPISAQAVESLVGGGATATAWELVDAMAEGSADRSVQILRRLLDKGEAVPALVGAIASRLRQMVVLRDERTSGRPNEAARRIVFPGRSVYFADALARKAARFSPRALLDAIVSLYEVDKRSKSTSVDGGALLEEWLVSVLNSSGFVRS